MIAQSSLSKSHRTQTLITEMKRNSVLAAVLLATALAAP